MGLAIATIQALSVEWQIIQDWMLQAKFPD
jgi:hypothetical protein